MGPTITKFYTKLSKNVGEPSYFVVRLAAPIQTSGDPVLYLVGDDLWVGTVVSLIPSDNSTAVIELFYRGAITITTGLVTVVTEFGKFKIKTKDGEGTVVIDSGTPSNPQDPPEVTGGHS